MAMILQGRFGKAAKEQNLFTTSEQESIALLFQKGQAEDVLTSMDCRINPGNTIYKLFGEYEQVPFPLATINKSNNIDTGEAGYTVSAWILDEHGDPDARSIRHLDNFNSVYHLLNGMIDLKFGKNADRFHDDVKSRISSHETQTDNNDDYTPGPLVS